MLGFLRLLALALLVLTVVYICLSLYSRSIRRDKLEQLFEKERAVTPSLSPAERDDYVRRGLKAYGRSLRRKLILGVYVVPLGLAAFIIYATNFM